VAERRDPALFRGVPASSSGAPVLAGFAVALAWFAPVLAGGMVRCVFDRVPLGMAGLLSFCRINRRTAVVTPTIAPSRDP
jgi:hypothetical protein